MRIEGNRLEQAEFRETSKPSFLNLPLNCHFEGNYKNNSYGEFPDFYEFTLYMIFTNFPVKGPSDNAYFREKFRKSYAG